MSIFNSLGSNYNLNFVLQALLSQNHQKFALELENLLEKKYQGEVILLYKGREAIELALKLVNLPQDSFVAITGFTCLAVYEAITKAGLKVEYLDLEKGELNFSSENLQKKISKNPKIKAVIVQNTLGYPCKIEEIAKICQDHHIILIEDLAHCVGTRYSNGLEAGAVGDLAVFSFSQDKMIDGISGGALINRTGAKPFQLESGIDAIDAKRQLIDRLYPFFTYLIRNTYPFGVGKILHFILKSLHLLSGPMDKLDNEIHQLPTWYCQLINLAFANLQSNLAHRQKIASLYVELINPKVVSPAIANTAKFSSNLRFPIFVNNRSDLIRFLENNHIFVSDIWYDAPISPKKYLSDTDYKNQCPNAELASSEILNLPTHLNISEKDAEKISNLINQWLTSK